MLVDQKTEGVIVPLNAELECEGKLELANSEFINVFKCKEWYLKCVHPCRTGSLSEMGVLGVSKLFSLPLHPP
jgi:hypothetical protein